MFSYLRFKLAWTDKVLFLIHKLLIIPLNSIKISGIWMVQWGKFRVVHSFGSLSFSSETRIDGDFSFFSCIRCFINATTGVITVTWIYLYHKNAYIFFIIQIFQISRGIELFLGLAIIGLFGKIINLVVLSFTTSTVIAMLTVFALMFSRFMTTGF